MLPRPLGEHDQESGEPYEHDARPLMQDAAQTRLQAQALLHRGNVTASRRRCRALPSLWQVLGPCPHGDSSAMASRDDRNARERGALPHRRRRGNNGNARRSFACPVRSLAGREPEVLHWWAFGPFRCRSSSDQARGEKMAMRDRTHANISLTNGEKGLAWPESRSEAGDRERKCGRGGSMGACKATGNSSEPRALIRVHASRIRTRSWNSSRDS
jgi:hypothetical protein